MQRQKLRKCDREQKKGHKYHAEFTRIRNNPLFFLTFTAFRTPQHNTIVKISFLIVK